MPKTPEKAKHERCSRWRLTVLVTLLAGCHESPEQIPPAQVPPTQEVSFVRPAGFAELEGIDDRGPAIRQFCGDCHAVPLPWSFPKDAWYEEVGRGFDFYHQSGRSDLTPPIPADVTSFYRQYAPAEFDLSDDPGEPSSTIAFVPHDVRLSWPDITTPPAVSFVDVHQNADGTPEIWFSDMRSGAAGRIAVTDEATAAAADLVPGTRINRNGIADNPVAVRSVDLDGNGIDDQVHCDLGSFLPEDHDRGRLIWVPDGTSPASGPPVTLLENVGRLADVAVADFTNDGLQDLVVAEFGWHKTGGIHLLVNLGVDNEQPRFESQLLDERPGTIHVIPVDLDDNGWLDFLALISQEHEVIVAFMNGPEGFRQREIYAAPDPSWGSSGIALADINGDGRQDILYTNGDTFDSNLIKPYHGIWWLENKGGVTFEPHHAAALPGVHRALPCDVDGDGDLDIVASALLPAASSQDVDDDQLQSMIWLEQTQPAVFARHVIASGRPIHAAIDIGDIDMDHRPDIIAGCFYEDGDQTRPLLKVFLNRGTVGTPPVNEE